MNSVDPSQAQSDQPQEQMAEEKNAVVATESAQTATTMSTAGESSFEQPVQNSSGGAAQEDDRPAKPCAIARFPFPAENDWELRLRKVRYSLPVKIIVFLISSTLGS